MSTISNALGLNSAPCDSCDSAPVCGNLLKCCQPMLNFVECNSFTRPDEPTFWAYDKLFGTQHRDAGFTIMTRGAFLDLMKCPPELSHKMCSKYLSGLYESSTGEKISVSGGELSLEWDWLFCVSNLPSVPMLVSAIGYSFEGSGAYVSYLYTRKFYQGIGCGSQLLSIIEEESDRVCLLPESDASRKWYEKMGYEQSEYEQNTWIKETSEQNELTI